MATPLTAASLGGFPPLLTREDSQATAPEDGSGTGTVAVSTITPNRTDVRLTGGPSMNSVTTPRPERAAGESTCRRTRGERTIVITSPYPDVEPAEVTVTEFVLGQ